MPATIFATAIIGIIVSPVGVVYSDRPSELDRRFVGLLRHHQRSRKQQTGNRENEAPSVAVTVHQPALSLVLRYRIDERQKFDIVAEVCGWRQLCPRRCPGRMAPLQTLRRCGRAGAYSLQRPECFQRFEKSPLTDAVRHFLVGVGNASCRWKALMRACQGIQYNSRCVPATRKSLKRYPCHGNRHVVNASSKGSRRTL